MPLTFAHPAIVLPLNYLPKRWVSLTALIAGSVAPDFEYFLRMKVSSIYSHTWAGMLWFDLPIAILLAFAYHNIARTAFIANMPNVVNARFSVYQTFNWNKHFTNSWLVVIISILIGIASHLFWDSFTHASGYFVQLWDMTAPISIASYPIPLYKIIQHTSTLIGGVVILIAIYNMPSQTPTANTKKWPYWCTVLIVTLTVVSLRMLFGLSIVQYWNVIVTTISGSIVGILIAPFLSNRPTQPRTRSRHRE